MSIARWTTQRLDIFEWLVQSQSNSQSFNFSNQ